MIDILNSKLYNLLKKMDVVDIIKIHGVHCVSTNLIFANSVTPFGTPFTKGVSSGYIQNCALVVAGVFPFSTLPDHKASLICHQSICRMRPSASVSGIGCSNPGKVTSGLSMNSQRVKQMTLFIIARSLNLHGDKYTLLCICPPPSCVYDVQMLLASQACVAIYISTYRPFPRPSG